MTILILALLIGIVAGLRAMTALAAISWAAHVGWLHLEGTWLAFLGYRFAPWICSVLALAELVTDQLPSTPSRKVPSQFGARIVTGWVCGAAIGASGGMPLPGALVGLTGALVGTLGGAAMRARLAALLGSDRLAAVFEDAAAIIGAYLIVSAGV